MEQTKLWPLRLVFTFRLGRWCTALVIFGGLTIIFGSLDAFDTGSDQFWAALFFAGLLSYMTPCFHYIIETSICAVDDLKPFMRFSEQEFVSLRNSIHAKSSQFMVLTLVIGGVAGLIHNYSMFSVQGEVVAVLKSLDRLGVVMILATFVTWCLMTTIIVVLINNAVIFARLGDQQVKVDLLNPGSLTPLARVAVISTLSIIGALTIFPLMFLEHRVNLLAMVPGMIALLIPLFWLFFLPIWPVHKRIRAAKQNELKSVQAQLAQLRNGDQIDQQLMASMQPLLIYRKEIEQVTEWPFDSVAIARLMLYLIIPPLTWVGAALIEILVDSLL